MLDADVLVEDVVHIAAAAGVGLDAQRVDRRAAEAVVDGVVVDVHVVQPGVGLGADGDAVATVHMVIGDGDVGDVTHPGLHGDHVVAVRNVGVGDGDVLRAGRIEAVGVGGIGWGEDLDAAHRDRAGG